MKEEDQDDQDDQDEQDQDEQEEEQDDDDSDTMEDRMPAGVDAEMALLAARGDAAATSVFGQAAVEPSAQAPVPKPVVPAQAAESSSEDDSDDSDNSDAGGGDAAQDDADVGSNDDGPEAPRGEARPVLQAPRTKNEILPEELPTSSLQARAEWGVRALRRGRGRGRGRWRGRGAWPAGLSCGGLAASWQVQLQADEQLQLAAKVCHVLGRTVVMQAARPGDQTLGPA